MKGFKEISMQINERPKVLLLGNGLLRLCEGIEWCNLLENISDHNDYDPNILQKIPYNMQAEALCGAKIEEIRKRLAYLMGNQDNLHISDDLRFLLQQKFDCILTTNYTYEAETVLLDKSFTESRRRSAIRTYGDARKKTNLQLCYEFRQSPEKTVDVWHIHGDCSRHNSMMLSYYTYARGISELFQFSKEQSNKYEEAQQENKTIPVKSWLDWFIVGDVYSVGFGWDFSEIDLWWAAERKSRENADVGKLYCYMLDVENDKYPDDKLYAKKHLIEKMNCDCRIIKAKNGYKEGYDHILDDIKNILV